MSGPFVGIIIEESLADKAVLHRVKIVSTTREPVGPEDGTPWLTQWTMHTIEVPAASADRVAKELSRSLDISRTQWYADFKDDRTHYIIFRDKIFKVDRRHKEQYDEVTRYGISVGIPAPQLDFSKDVIA